MDDHGTSNVQLTVSQAARHAGVSTKTIRRWLSNGRLEARFDGVAYSIDEAALDRATSNGRPLDVPHPAPRDTGHVQSPPIVQELLDRLERQAGEIVALRLERDQLAVQIKALSAPPTDSPEMVPGRDSEGVVGEPAQTSAVGVQATPLPRAPWWQWWARHPRPAG